MIKIENYPRSQYVKDMELVYSSMNNMEFTSVRDIDWYIMLELSKISNPVRRLAKNRSFKNKGFKLFKKYHN